MEMINSSGSEDVLYLLGIYPFFSELEILGVYTDKRKLVEAYNRLVLENEKCLKDKRFLRTPIIYALPLNKFIGRKDDLPWYCSVIEEYEVTIEEVVSHVKIAEFYGVEVYCDLNFTNGPFFDFYYYDEVEYPYAQLNIERRNFVGPLSEKKVVKEWIADNESLLIEIWKHKMFVDIPDW